MTTDDPTIVSLRTPGVRVSVRIRGAGRPVVMLHGGGPGTSSADWRDAMRAMGPDVQCFAPDFPGFGFSGGLEDGRDYSHATFVDTVLAAMDALCLDKVTLVGHSMGGAVAAALSVLHPDRVAALVLVAPGGGFYGINDYDSAGMSAIAKAIEDPSEAHIRALVALMCHRPEGQAWQVSRRLETLRNPLVMETLRAMQGKRVKRSEAQEQARAALGEKIREFEAPVTLVWGANERFNPVELGQRILGKLPPGAGYELVPDAGHNVQCDQPAVMARIIEKASLASRRD